MTQRLLIGVVDRTGTVRRVAEELAVRHGDARVLDFGRPVDFGASSPRAGVLLLGPGEITEAGLRREHAWRKANPVSATIAFVPRGGPTTRDLQSRGLSVVREPLTVARALRVLDAVLAELSVLNMEQEPDAGDPAAAEAVQAEVVSLEGEGLSEALSSALEEALEEALSEGSSAGEPDDGDDGEGGSDAPEGAHVLETLVAELDGQQASPAESVLAASAAAPRVPWGVVANNVSGRVRPSEATQTLRTVPAVPATARPVEVLEPAEAAVPHRAAVSAPEPPVASQPSQALATIPERVDQGSVITIASATGGCGKTFYATNLAAALADAGHRVVLVDLDLQFGEVSVALRLQHPYSIYDGLYDSKGRPLPEGAFAAQLSELVAHHSLGFDVIVAPRSPEFADYVGAADAARVLRAVTPAYDFVIVDTPPSLNEVVLTALDASDLVAIMATPDVPSLKNLRVFLDTLGRLRISDRAVRLILNKVEKDIGLDVPQMQDAFNGKFIGVIPQSPVVSRAINAGTVALELAPQSPVARRLRESMEAVLPPGLLAPARPAPHEPARRRWLRSLAQFLRHGQLNAPMHTPMNAEVTNEAL
jgi:pilus assembly protein CpaE